MKRWVVLLGLVLCLAACGSEDPNAKKETGATDDERAVRDLFAKYESAFAGRQFAAVCAMSTQEFIDDLIAEVREAINDRPVTCPMALEVVSAGIGSGEQALGEVEVSGDTARGEVNSSTWRFARVDGAWKVAYAN